MVGHHLGQLVVRIGLAATFLTMGLSKVMREAPFEGEAAAALANMGVIKPVTPGAPAEGVETTPTRYQPEEPAGQPEEPAGEPGEQPAGEPPSRGQAPEEPEIRSLTPGREAQESAEEAAEEAAEESASAATTERYTAADFPEPVMLPRVYGIALMLKGAAHPAPNEDGTDRMALVPTWAADTKVPGLNMSTPVVLAWLAAITEIVGGGMLLVGFMSRLWALGLVGVMLTAIWLTAIGPAMQGGNAFLGFLPNKGHVFDFDSHGPLYMHEFWQLALLCMAASVMFAGPGALSIDGILFGGSREDEGGDD